MIKWFIIYGRMQGKCGWCGTMSGDILVVRRCMFQQVVWFGGISRRCLGCTTNEFSVLGYKVVEQPPISGIYIFFEICKGESTDLSRRE